MQTITIRLDIAKSVFRGSRCGGKAVLSLADPRTDIRNDVIQYVSF
jgi:hypothetical protein